MSAVRAYAIWKLKPGIEIEHDDLTYFSPGGFTFTHKSGKNVGFDFEENRGNYETENRLIDFDLKEIDNDLITAALEYDNYKDLIQEQYDIEFFKDGKIDLSNEFNEIYCCMDLKINGEINEDVDDSKYVEPVYLELYDPYDTNNTVILYDKLTDDEKEKYFN